MIKIFTLFIAGFIVSSSFGQDCSLLSVSCQPFESRCAATGRIEVTANNGSGIYNYRVTGPVSTSYSSSNIITGLSAGTYTVTVRDVVYDCTISILNVVVPGTYDDPRFNLLKTDVSCLNGMNGSISVAGVAFGRQPFSYSIVAPSPNGIGTTNSSGVFNNLPAGVYFIRLTDSCGGIQTRNIEIFDYDWWIVNTVVTKTSCTEALFHIILSDIYSNSNLNPSDTAFNGFVYGIVKAPGDTTWSNNYDITVNLGVLRTVTIIVKDKCGNIKTMPWTDTVIPSVGANVALSNYTCSTFTARITNQQNLTNPNYCLFDNISNPVPLACNSTGVFTNLNYGDYCIKVINNCYDTTIVRCFTAVKPKPSVNELVTISYVNCDSSSVSIQGQLNLFNGQYCLYDYKDSLLRCNTTGVFDSLAFGNYCIKITSPGCYDTTITRCFTLVPPVYGNGLNVSISKRSCIDFTATVEGQSNFTSANYCLYDYKDSLLRCSTSPIFVTLKYGSYCIVTSLTGGVNSCYDTTIRRCFTVEKPTPSVSASVNISNKTCTDFTARITGQSNLINAEYCLYSGATLIRCDSSGRFDNLPFGSYCIEVKNGCNDTTIQRCFTVSQDVLAINTTAGPSCEIGRTRIRVSITNGESPFRIEVYNPSNILMGSLNNLSNGTYYFGNYANLAFGQSYRVMGFDACNNSVTNLVAPVVTTISKNIAITNKCPGGTTPLGSSDLTFTLNSNLGTWSPGIIKHNGATVNIPYDIVNSSSTIFTFLDLGPGTYIFESQVSSSSPSNCNTTVFDTVVIAPYQFPTLLNSSLYQCDNNGFRASAAVTGGIGPFQYEITGSVPALPSIVAPLQTSPDFNFNTGTVYSLVRLRALDGCGNASINDISVLPLANVVISTQNRCMNNNITLHVDSIPNATYTWYRRIWPNDSVQVGTSMNYNVPMLLPTDTGTYICKVNVGNGCIQRVSYFLLDGMCGHPLVNESTKLNGNKVNDKVKLEWITLNETGLKEYIIERKNENNTGFRNIAVVKLNPLLVTVNANHWYEDNTPSPGINFYRIKIIASNGKVSYSNEIAITNKKFNSFSVFPNPAKDEFNIRFSNNEQKKVIVKLIEANGRVVLEKKIVRGMGETINIPRPAELPPGLYLLSVKDLATGITDNRNIIFR